MRRKKGFAFCLVISMLLMLAACSQSPEAPSSEVSPLVQADLFVIPGAGALEDESFNQVAWEAAQAYASEKQWECASILPEAEDDAAYETAIQMAVSGGAKIIIALGSSMETAIYKAQTENPDVAFLLIDGNPQDGNGNYVTASNCVGIVFAEEQAGFLAGYGAVMEGYTKIGFLGGEESPAVTRYGYGFLQGAEAAAAERGIETVDAKYHYTGTYFASPEIEERAASWYQSGTEVIFACGGEIGLSVMAAAEKNNGTVIGVDVDQSSLSETVLSSAMKSIAASVQEVLGQYDAGTFPGGESLLFDASNNGVQLEMEHSRFQTFTQEQYDAVYEKLKTFEIALLKDTSEDGQPLLLTDLPLQIVQFGVVG